LAVQVRSFGAEIDKLGHLAESFNPRSVLARGYSVTRRDNGQLLKNSEEVEVGEKIVTDLSHGKIDSIVEMVE
jgi:exodeoxyribonuclease VII large subunit